MHTRTQARRATLARAAALLAILSVASSLSSRQAEAQLGSLVVTMTSPASGSTVSGTTTASASVSIIGALTVGGVQFTLDGVNLGAEDASAPYSIPWNTRTASNGSHALRAVARDLLGVRWTSQPVTVTVFNDTTLPSVSITSPVPGSTVRGSLAVNGSASDNVGVVGVQFRLDGVALGAEDTAAPYSVPWTTTTASNGSHSLTAVARDAAGNVATSAAVTLVVDNAFPTVAMTAPVSGSTVARSITVSAGASDNVGVVGVQFRLDGAALGAEDTAAPYSVPWTTTSASNGSHSLTAVARDAAGNVTTSAVVTVTVDNAFPTVTMTAPASGSTVAGSITASASASDNVGVVGVQFRLDGAALGAEDTAPPYSVPWTTTSASNGSHSLTAVARDAAGNVTTSAAITVTVSNDSTPPTVSLTSPASGATVSGTVTVTSTAADNVGVVGVQFRLDGAALGAEDTAAPYSVPWTTTTVSNGSHTLTAVARDAAGNVTTSAAITVTVSNDSTPPTVSLTSPASGATVSGTVTVTSTAADNVGVVGVQFRLDGAALGAEDTAAPYSVPWTTTTVSNGSHTLTAVARDARGNVTTSAAVTVTVSNDSSLPTVTLTSPAAGATVSGTITVTASASDNVGVAGVQFRLDGASLGTEDTAAPYSISWNTTLVTSGSHTLTAVARDAAGNTATSTAVTVTVSNDSTQPAVTLTSPAAGATVSGTITVTASASDNVGVVGVQFRLDGASLGTEDTAAPYSISWNTTPVTNGSHTLTAVARDAAGNSATSGPVTVTVTNTAQTLRLEEISSAVSYVGGWNHGNTARPWSGGTATLGFAAGHRATLSFSGTGVSWIGFKGSFAGIANVYLDGPLVATVDSYAAAETVQAVLYTTSGLTSGVHTLTIEATGTRNAASVDNIVVVDAFDITGAPSDSTPPTVTITTPTAGTTAFGAVPVTANATDNIGVAGVRFFVDGAQIGAEDTVSPYSISWETTTVTDGSHTLTAAARDGAGQTTTSAGVTVTVSNASPPPTATATRIEETDPSIIYTPGTPGPGQPGDWWHGSRSRGWTLGTASFNRSAGGRATITFTGTSVTWLSFRAPWAGIARVFVDGTFVTELDLYQPTEQTQAPVFTASNLSAGSHTLTVESTGLKNASSSDYPVVVDAFDVSPSSPPPPAGTRFEETATATSFTSGWTQGDSTRPWSGTTAAVSVTQGARAVFTFAGTSVRWVGLSGPHTGIARVYVDGAFQGQIDTYAPTEIQTAVFAVSGLAAARHRLEIEVTGQKNAAATTSAIVVDAFDMRPRVEDPDPSITYSGVWTQQDTIRAYSGTSLQTGGGTAARSATAGARAQFAFTGTSVSWVGVRGPWLGLADVFLDGAFATRVDLYSPTEVVQATVFSASGLAAGAHTLRIDVTGEKNPAATSAFVVVDGFDVPLPAAAPVVTRVQETDPSISYAGAADWPQAGFTPLWSGENARNSTTAGARATFTFTGTSVRWIGERGFGTGIARVLLDGAFVAQVDTRTPLQEEYQAALFAATGLAPGSHTLTIEVIGRNNESPGATVERVVVDAFEVY